MMQRLIASSFAPHAPHLHKLGTLMKVQLALFASELTCPSALYIALQHIQMATGAASTTSIGALPPEILQHICNFLQDRHDLASAHVVNTRCVRPDE
jgi:hypothetical protein